MELRYDGAKPVPEGDFVGIEKEAVERAVVEYRRDIGEQDEYISSGTEEGCG